MNRETDEARILDEIFTKAIKSGNFFQVKRLITGQRKRLNELERALREIRLYDSVEREKEVKDLIDKMLK